MSTVKKSILMWLAILFIMLAACQTDSPDSSRATDYLTVKTSSSMTSIAVESMTLLTETTSAGSLIPNNSTTLRDATASVFTSTSVKTKITISTDGILRTGDLKAFLDEYEQAMLMLITPLLDEKIAGDKQAFDENLRKGADAFYAIAAAETNWWWSTIAFEEIDGRRIFHFAFFEMDRDARILYMPDGYVKWEHPEPLMQGVDLHETKLAENWYSFYW